MAKDRTRQARRREPQPERAEMSLSELAFLATLAASATERVRGLVADAMQGFERLRRAWNELYD